MGSMTGKERIQATLNLQSTDRAPIFEHFWGDTQQHWQEQGKIPAGADLNNVFDLELRTAGWLNTVADLDFEQQVLEETDETILTLDGNGATMRRHKLHASTPEHVGFSVEECEDWEEKIKPFIVKTDRRRIPFESYRATKDLAAKEEKFFCFSYVAPFEQMHPICGHEYMLMGMAEDPEWVQDMVNTYVDFTIRHANMLFEEEGEPDGIWFYEDMGFKGKPFMSPAMYEDIVMPGHKRLFDWAHSMGKKVIVHSCGFVEALVPGLVEAGMDCLQAMEVKAGMDMPRIAQQFGDRISFCGNFDVRALISNDKEKIEEELQKKVVPMVENGWSWIGHSDHSIPPDVEFETLQYFHQRIKELTAQ